MNEIIKPETIPHHNHIFFKVHLPDGTWFFILLKLSGNDENDDILVRDLEDQIRELGMDIAQFERIGYEEVEVCDPITAQQLSHGRTSKFNIFNEEYANKIIEAYKNVVLPEPSEYPSLYDYLRCVQNLALNPNSVKINLNCFSVPVQVTVLKDGTRKIIQGKYNFAHNPHITIFIENSNILLESLFIALPFIVSKICNNPDLLSKIGVNQEPYTYDEYGPNINLDLLRKLVNDDELKQLTTEYLYEVLLALRLGPNGFVARGFKSASTNGYRLSPYNLICGNDTEKLRRLAIDEQKKRAKQLSEFFKVLHSEKFHGKVFLVHDYTLLLNIGSSYGCPLKSNRNKEQDPFWHIAVIIIEAVKKWFNHVSSSHQEQ